MSEFEPRERGRRIQQAIAKQSWSEAVALLDEWLRHYPRHAPGWLWRAGSLERLGRLEEALESARKAHMLAPSEAREGALLQRLERKVLGEGGTVGPGSGAVETVEPDAAEPEPTLAEAEDSAAEPEVTLVEEEGAGEPEATLVEPDSGGGGLETTPTLGEQLGPAASPEATLVDGGSGLELTVQETLREPVRGRAPGEGAAAAGPPVTMVEPPTADRAELDTGAAVPATAVEEPASPLPATPISAERWVEGALIEGRYEVRGGARGGMGEVYFVHDRELGLDIAVKTPLASALATAAGRARFFREAEAWIALGLHPNICAAYYVRVIGGVPRLFIEFIDGGSLGEWLPSHHDTTLEARLDLALQIASGMHHAHTFAWQDEEGQEHRGVVHRDLKAANVLIGADGVARVTDFGLVGRGGAAEEEPSAVAAAELAGRVEATLVEGDDAIAATGTWGTVTMGGRALGTPPYMAPEQWAGAHAAGRAVDIYAFGCILYELLCGRRPFTLDPKYRQAQLEIQLRTWEHMHRSASLPDPRTLVSGFDNELAGVLLACIAKDPAARPQSFAALASTLRGIYARLVGSEYPRPEPTASELQADSLNNRGVSFASLGQLQRAERAWRQALAADPQHVQSAFNLSLLQWRRGGVSDADLANRMEELRRGHGAGWRSDLLTGRAYLCLGRYDQAVERLRAASEASNEAPEAARDCAFALCALAGEGSDPEPWRQASELLFRAGGALRNDGAMLTCYALALARRGEGEKSQRLWEQARQRLDGPPEDLQRAAERVVPGAVLVRRPTAFSGRLHSLAVDPEGRIGLSGGDHGWVNVWDLARGELVRNLRGADERVRCVAVAPGRELGLSSSGSDPVTVWDLATGARVRRLQMHSGYLNELVVSGDGRVAAGVGSAGTLNVWELASGKRRVAVKAHEGFASCVALSHDAGTAVTGGGDGTVRVFDLRGKRCVATLAAHTGAVTAVTIAADARGALSGGEDGLVRVWDLASGECSRVLAGHSASLPLVALDRGGHRALTAGADGSLRLWDLDSAELVKAEWLEDGAHAGAASADLGAVLVTHGSTLAQYAFRETPNYRPAWVVSFLVTASEASDRAREFRDHLDSSRRLVNEQDFATAYQFIERARTVAGYERAAAALELAAQVSSLFPRKGLKGGWEEKVLVGHEAPVTAVVPSPLGERALSAGRDRRLVLWSLDREQALATIDAAAISVAAAFLDDHSAVTADLDNVVRIWDLDGLRRTLQLAGHEARIHAVAVDPLARCVLTASGDQTARLWDPSAGACTWVLEGHLGQVMSAAVCPDARTGLTGGDDGSLLLWDLVAGKGIGELAGHGGAVDDLEWSVDGRYALSCGRDGTVKLWDARSGRCLRTVDEGLVDPRRVALSSDSRYAMVGEESGRVCLVDLRERRVARAFEGHTGAVSAVAFTRTGRRVLSASADGSLRLWHLDWEPGIRPFAQWDEAARPHLEVFLAQHSPRHAGKELRPEWGEDDVCRLLSDLRHRGLGWIRPDGVRQRLEQLAEEWSGPPSPVLPSAAVGRPGRVVTPRARERRRSKLGRILIAAAVAIPLVIAGDYLYSRMQLRYHPRNLKDRRDQNLAALVLPSYMARATDCDQDRLAEYLRDFAEATDSPRTWGNAAYCIETLKDPRSVSPLLDMIRPQPPPERPDPIQIGSDRSQIFSALRRAMSGGVELRTEIASMLARLGDGVNSELVEALDDPEETVRNVAAQGLALRASADSIEVLLDQLDRPEARVRRAVSRQFASIACSRQLEIEEVFALAERLARDDDHQVRLSAVQGLEILEGRRTRGLARQLADDPDPDVSAAARGYLR